MLTATLERERELEEREGKKGRERREGGREREREGGKERGRATINVPYMQLPPITSAGGRWWHDLGIDAKFVY